MAKHTFVVAMLWALCLLQAFASNIPRGGSKAASLPAHLNHVLLPRLTARQLQDPAIPSQVKNTTQSDVDRAREVVRLAVAEAGARNRARLDHPARNTYHAESAGASLQRREAGNNASFTAEMLEAPPVLVDIDAATAAAAALLAEVDAVAGLYSPTAGNATVKRRQSSFWMENIQRKGSMPWGDDPEYQVFRNVRDFGARGDGVHDDTAAIRRAILAPSSGRPEVNARGSGGSTTRNAIVYFPVGTYLVSGAIHAVSGTQLIGDATDRPVLLAAPSFVGLGVISAGEYGHGNGTASSGQASTGSFYRQIRNLVIDITAASQDANLCGIHHQAAQATSLQFVEVRAADPRLHPNTTQVGVFGENGSGGHMSDLTFVGGRVGFYGGNQQFTAQRIKFRGCGTAVQLVWDWGWVWKDVEIADSEVGFKLHGDGQASKGYIGSVYLMDSTFSNVGTAVRSIPAELTSGSGTTGITLDNVVFSQVTHYVFDGEKEYVEGKPAKLDTWTLGPLYLLLPERDLSLGYEFETFREEGLLADAGDKALPKRPYFERAKPQYGDVTADRWIRMKDFARGDGVADDTEGFQKALDKKGYIFVDSGVYLLTDTVTVHPGTVLVGEAWSQIAATRDKFADVSNPRVMFKVGERGDVGSVEVQDLLFTTKGATAGVILVEWNIKADGAGKAGMWDSHIRIGGATGTGLTTEQCPAGSTSSNCTAASLMMHITPGASAYLENVWLWAADHQIDLANGAVEPPLISIYAARGLLVESTEPTWLYGTSAEHSVMYQYNFHRAKKLFAAMIQTESPYFQSQSTLPAPIPSAADVFPSDPDYSRCGSEANVTGCDGAWAVIMQQTEDVFVAGLALYSFFSGNSADCISQQKCQNTLMLLKNNTKLALHNLVTIGATNTLVSDGAYVPAADNLAIDAHPRWSQLTVFYPIQNSVDALACRDISSWPATPPNGKFRNPDSNDGKRFFVTMINGCLARLINYRKDSYQMTEFTFGDVDPGFSPQNSMYYGPGTFVDTNGEAYYRIEGTSKTFQIRGTTNDKDSTHKMRARYVFDGMSANGVAQGSNIELRSRGGERAVNFVLTGSEKVGYWTSVNPPVAWMRALLPIIGPRKLRHISMLGSHNAGIYYRNGGTVGPEAASLCQGVGIYQQLAAGSRWFDIRPVIGNGGQLLTGHYSGQTAPVFGINGASLAEVVADVNRFTEEHAELVVLSLTHAMQTDEGYRVLDDAEWGRVLDALEGLTRRCPGLQGQIPDMTLESLIGGGRACVIVLLADGDGPAAGRPGSGIYRASASFDFVERWSDSNSASAMAADQTSWVRANRNLVADAGGRRDRFAVMQWIMTVKGLDTLTTAIEKYAVDIAYDALFWRAFASFSPWSFPSVVLLDYVGILYRGDRALLAESGEARAFAMAVNVGLASRNCWVGGGSLE